MRVLITGGTGSLGRELVKQFVAQEAERIVVYSRDEVKQGDMKAQWPTVRYILGDVRDRDSLHCALWGIDTVIHAAALKRVDEVSYNPRQVLKTNILGTENVLMAALETDVERVLVISSDKAVAPANVYGGTKFMAEQLTIRHNVLGIPQGLASSVLRYGNVWGSRGSIVHVFREQMAKTGRLTVTDPTMTRFFLTLPEAGRYVQQALTLMQGGEIFVPVLPAWTLAQVAALFAPREQWDITGLRPGGEKVHEALLLPVETARARVVDAFYVVPPDVHEWGAEFWTDALPIKRSTIIPYTSQYADPVLTPRLTEALRELDTGVVMS